MINKGLEKIKGLVLKKRISVESIKHQLSEYTPKELKEIAESGNAQDVLDEKSTLEIELITGTRVKFAIMGFNHDDKTDGTKNGITFGLVDCIDIGVPYNHEYSTQGGWGASYARGICQKILKLLPKEWQAIIAEVDKTTYCEDEEDKMQITQDKIFYPSKTEVSGEGNGGIMEGEQYEYFKDKKNRIKHCNGNNAWWALRSPNSGYADNVSSVYSSGIMGTDSADFTFYVAPCFVI